MNLNDQEKKLYSRALIVLGTIILVGIIYFSISRISTYYENRNITKSKVLIEKFETRVDSLNVINKNLSVKNEILILEIDSLHKIKYQIIIANEKKINTVYNAAANNHAEWLDATLKHLAEVDSL